MRATELQIGDWAKYTNPPYIKVASITKKKIGYHVKDDEPRMHHVRLCEVEPIPITAEILEKNGFALVHEQLPYRMEYVLSFQETYVSVVFWHNNKILVKMETPSSGNRGVNNVHNCDINHIHELQHALRLYGIDKEIEL